MKRAHIQYVGEKRPTSRCILVKFLNIKQKSCKQKKTHYTNTHTIKFASDFSHAILKHQEAVEKSLEARAF